MGLSQKIGLAGAAFGLVLAIVAGLVGGVPFVDILIRSLIASLVSGGIFLGAWTLAIRFLPELNPQSSISDDAHGTDDGPIDITVADDDSGSDQASDLRTMAAAGSRSTRSFEDEDIIEEVRDEPAVSTPVDDNGPGFSEEAFYSNIDQLPDIGGFSDSFGSSGDDDAPTVDTGISDTPVSGGGGSTKGGMDPKLMAQAISTALKKGS